MVFTTFYSYTLRYLDRKGGFFTKFIQDLGKSFLRNSKAYPPSVLLLNHLPYLALFRLAYFLDISVCAR